MKCIIKQKKKKKNNGERFTGRKCFLNNVQRSVRKVRPP